MKLGCVLTACDLNPAYTAYIPVFISSWARMHPDVDVKVVLVAEEVPAELRAHSEHLILFSPPAGVHTAFAAQCVRLLYPGLLDCDGAVMITDVDYLPLNGSYYRDALAGHSDGSFVSTAGKGYPFRNQLPMMHSSALPAVWRDVFQVSSAAEAGERLRRMFGRAPNAKGTLRYVAYHTLHGVARLLLKDLPRRADWHESRRRFRRRFKSYFWAYDEKELYRRVMSWNKRTGGLVLLDAGATGRRVLWRVEGVKVEPNLARDIAAGLYSGYHGPRRYGPVVEEVAALAPDPGEARG